MQHLVLFVITVAFLFSPVTAIVNVQPFCSASDFPFPSMVRVVSDESPFGVFVDCANGTTFTALTYDNVEYTLNIFYSGDQTQQCIFHDKHYKTLFWVGVRVVKGGLVQQETLKYVMSCGHGRHVTNITDENVVNESDAAPIEIQHNVGLEAISSFGLTIQNVRGDFLEGIIPLGKKIRLRANATGAVGEAGIRPLSCVAIGGSGVTYSILRAGCGDGYVFKRHTGFSTKGLEVTSNYFKAFRLRGSRELTFQCNFTVCNTTCDGDSCSLEVLSGRRRRDIIDEVLTDKIATANTGTLVIETDKYISKDDAQSDVPEEVDEEIEIIPQILQDAPGVGLSGEEDFILMDEAGRDELDIIDRGPGARKDSETTDSGEYGLFLVLGLCAAVLILSLISTIISHALRRRTEEEPGEPSPETRGTQRNDPRSIEDFNASFYA